MLFRKKETIRQNENRHLLAQIEQMKLQYDNQKHLIEHSVEPSEDVMYRAKLAESLYTFLLREARVRKARKNKL